MIPWSPHLQQHPMSTLPSLALIERAYEASADPSLWPRWFGELASSLAHRATNIVLRGFGQTRYVNLDAPKAGFTTLNPGRVFEHKALSRSSFALAWVAGELVDDWSQLRSEGAARVGIEVFTDESRSLIPSDRHLLRLVLPHLQRALTLHFRLETARREHNTFGACLDELCTGMLVLDGRATVLHANRAARECLRGQHGFEQRGGELRVMDADMDARFRARLKRALSGDQRSLTCTKLRSGATLWLRGLDDDRAVAYVVSDPQPRSMAPEHLAVAFELTPAESRVASLFARGDDVDKIAATLTISVHTVRLHIKKMQLKTGTHRQASLIRRLLETVPSVTP